MGLGELHLRSFGDSLITNLNPPQMKPLRADLVSHHGCLGGGEQQLLLVCKSFLCVHLARGFNFRDLHFNS